MIGTQDHDHLLTFMHGHHRCRITLIGFFRCIHISFLLPDRLSGLLIEGSKIRWTAVHAGDHDMFLRQDRGCSEVPPKRILTVPLLKIDMPDQFSFEVQTGKITTFEVDKNGLSISHR